MKMHTMWRMSIDNHVAGKSSADVSDDVNLVEITCCNPACIDCLGLSDSNLHTLGDILVCLYPLLHFSGALSKSVNCFLNLIHFQP